jgi:hypothetical protein
MPPMIYLMLRSALFETPPAAAPQEKGRVSKHASMQVQRWFAAFGNF